MPRWIRRLMGHERYGDPIPRGWQHLIGPNAVEVRVEDVNHYIGEVDLRRWAQPDTRIFLDPDKESGGFALHAGGDLMILRPRQLLEMKVSRMARGIPYLDFATLARQGLSNSDIRRHRAGWLENVLYPLMSADERVWSKDQPGVGGPAFPMQLATRRALRNLPDFLEPFLGV